MLSKIMLLSVLVLSVGLIGSASAHKSQVVGDYSVEVGWGTEPPIVGMDNTITVGISPATAEDKTNSDTMNNDTMSNDTMAGDNTMHDHAAVDLGPENGIGGLASSLDVTVTLNGKKTVLTMTEDENIVGLYAGKYTPAESGFPSVQVFTTIENTPVEATFHPEEIKDGAMLKSISSDGSVTVNVIATAPAKDKIMNIALEFTDHDNNPIEEVNYDVTVTQDGNTVLDETNVHTPNGEDSHITESLSSDNPANIQIKILGIGEPDDSANWTGPKGDTTSLKIVPEFGSVAMMILVVSIISIVAVTAKFKVIPRL
jgi:predicted secreted protein with PEFG-CTERM motif